MKTGFTFKHLEKITDGNNAALKELLEIFIKEGSAQIQQLELFLSNGELSVVKHTAHKIKSSLTLLGLDKFRPLAEKIEKAAHENTGSFKEDVSTLISVYREAQEELKIKLKELS
ncbi:MAG: Hpt domain-containing protein [Bacteroidia bacterium]